LRLVTARMFVSCHFVSRQAGFEPVMASISRVVVVDTE
jgi:hypothetical protein